MNKKGFTLIEMLGVIVIIVIISMISFPSIYKAITKNKNDQYLNYEKLIQNTADLYVQDKMEDLYPEETSDGKKNLSLDDLLEANPNLKIGGGCAITNNSKAAVVNRINTYISGSGDDQLFTHKYIYTACITCTENGRTVYTSNYADCN